MRILFPLAFGLLLISAVLAIAAEAVSEEKLDAASARAAKLEAQLAKQRDTSPEAAELLVELVNLYHAEGRPFGLIRVGEQFVSKHPNHKQHRDVMAKLIDGLLAMSRNKDLVATTRQFMTRYPQDKECPRMESIAAQSLNELGDRAHAAEAYLEVWKRLGATPEGRGAATAAIWNYSALNSAEGFAKAAETADAVFEALPPGEYALEVGWQAFQNWRRVNNSAKSNAAGNKILAKNPPTEPGQLSELHRTMAENYAAQNQRANAVESLRKARAVGDWADLHARMIAEMNYAAAPPTELEPVVNEYLQKYPDRFERYVLRSYLAHAYLRAMDKPRAMAILAEIMPFDASSNSSASHYVQQNGTEPEQLAQSEKVLLDALSKNARDAALLRYVLASELYRDRMKDPAKTRQMFLQLVTQSPTNDANTQQALNWLLYNPASEEDFQATVNAYLKMRPQYYDQSVVRNCLAAWINEASQNKDHQAHAAWAKNQLAAADQDPLLKEWLAIENPDGNAAFAARIKLFNEQGKTLNDRQYSTLGWAIAEGWRSHPDAAQRTKALEYYPLLAKRNPGDANIAQYWIAMTSDHAQTESGKLALENMLTREGFSNSEQWRRSLMIAEQLKDDKLVHRVYDWILQAQQKYGYDPGYPDAIGDILDRHGMKPEALEYWRKSLAHADPNSQAYFGAAQRLVAQLQGAERTKTITDLVAKPTDYLGMYTQWLAGDYLAANDLDNFEKVLAAARKTQNERPFRPWNLAEDQVQAWVDAFRGNKDAKPEARRRIYSAVKSLELGRASAVATLALLEMDSEKMKPLERLLAYQTTTLSCGDDSNSWDRLMAYAQAAMARKDYAASATLLTGLLSNVPNVDEPRKQSGRDMVAQSYARMGGVGLTIDESSPIAPLLQAALYLRLGDERLAFETYSANKKLFDEHRYELPVDLLLFVSESLMAAGGDENLDRAEDTLRGWLLKNSEVSDVDDATKAAVQLLLAKTYFKAQRYDVARGEFATVINRYAKTPQAVDAEFGIGESFMAQKVYDQAEAAFEKLAGSHDRDVVIRAEFLRGVLANRRGDRDEARDIFRAVLERVPNIELANQALFNLAEVYGAEERYIDQLELLRTVGRLGRTSKRWHAPGTALSIVVQDSDLGISRGHARIPVRVTTEPGGDEELIYLYSGGAGKGLFRADLDTRLGEVSKHDKVLELTGRDVIKCDYPDEFKAEFRSVPLSDAEIRVASNAILEVGGSKIVDDEAESFSARLERESHEREALDERVSQRRPANQIKPGNPLYFRVQDADRDLSNDPDKVTVKLSATSGDQVQVSLVETGAHSGVFEAAASTGELPAGALASDTAIEHSPLMAIDQDKDSYWLSEPDGATPKWLAVDMKDLHSVSRVTIATPNALDQSPVRGELQGSHDGRFWFRLAGSPAIPAAEPVAGEFGPMQIRVYSVNFTQITDWRQVVELTKTAQPIETAKVEHLNWKRLPADAPDAQQPFVVVWQGKFVQPRAGALRMAVHGNRTALMVNGTLDLGVGEGNRSVDLWLEKGAHTLTAFSAVANGQQGAQALIARPEATQNDQVTLAAFRAADFDLQRPEAKVEPARAEVPSNLKEVKLGLDTVKLNVKTPQFAVDPAKDKLGFWQSPEDSAQWEFEVPEAGVYDVIVEYARQGAAGQYRVEFGKQVLTAQVSDTGAWEKFVPFTVGTILVPKAGAFTLLVKPVDLQPPGLFDLRSVTIRQAVGARTIVVGGTWAFRFPARDLRHVRFLVSEYRGQALALNRFEVGGDKPGQLYIPTKTDVLQLAGNDTLEMAAGDTITASYTDEVTQTSGDRAQLLTKQMSATYFNASVAPITYDFVRQPNGSIEAVRKQLMRIDPGERFVMEITDFDEDKTSEPDKVKFQVSVNDGDAIELEAQETKPYSGVFTKEVDTASAADGSKLVVKPGDRIVCRYLDAQNTFPGHSVPREVVVYVNRPTEGQLHIVETRVVRAPQGSNAPPQVIYLPTAKPRASSDSASADKAAGPADQAPVRSVAFEAPLTIEVLDPDAAKNSRSEVLVKLATTSGAAIEVRCVVSPDLSAGSSGIDAANVALEEGRFIGQVLLQLGGKDSPDVVPITASMPRNLIGGGVMIEDADAAKRGGESLLARVLNLSGKDIITATYLDAQRPQGKARPLDSRGRLIANGTLFCTDHDYERAVTHLHVGEKLFLMVNDADLDVSDERDKARVEISSERGEKETIALEETLTHSGVFTGSIALRPSESPTPGNLEADDPAVETYFGDLLHVLYADKTASTESGKLDVELSVPVVVGTDGAVGAFSKAFDDEALAVETQFHIAESCFELFKSHKTLGRKEEQRTDLENGRRVLREVMEDYPNPRYAPRVAYLLGQFSQELGKWDEAISSYQMIVRQYADSTLAADAQYKLAQCYEEAGDFDSALEAYVTLAATYPKSPLIANVMVRISDHFYKKENFDVSAQVGEKFLERFDGHEWSARMAFRVGQCYFKGKQFGKATTAFDKFAKMFPEDPLCADALFWSGESFRAGNNARDAFRRYNRCRWDFPASEAAKYARGRLNLPEMLQQFESEATTDE